MNIYSDLSTLTYNIVRDMSRNYNEVSEQFSREISLMAQRDPIAASIRWLGRQVRYIKDEVIPALGRYTPQAVSSVAKNAFWVAPVLAIAMGHAMDAFLLTNVGLLSLLSSHPDAERMSEHCALYGFGITALLIGINTLQCVATRDPSKLVSVIFQLFAAVKLGMIIDGSNR